MTAIIEIWSSFLRPVILDREIGKSELHVKCVPGPVIDEKIAIEVKRHFEAAQAEDPSLYDKPIAYLLHPPKIAGKNLTLDVHQLPFSYTHAFNRDQARHHRMKDLGKYKLLSASNHLWIVTSDRKALFGTKKNQRGQITAFSGFPNLEEETVKLGAATYVDEYRALNRSMRQELGDITSDLQVIGAVGMTYVDSPGMRGTDIDYTAWMHSTADMCKRHFKESEQFEPGLFTIEFTPKGILRFLDDILSAGKVMSPYALGCAYLNVKSIYGPDEARQFHAELEKRKVPMLLGNSTDYFRE